MNAMDLAFVSSGIFLNWQTQIGQTGKTENRIGYQIFFVKTENQMLKNRKYAIRNEHLNRETDVFWNKNRKTDLKNR